MVELDGRGLVFIVSTPRAGSTLLSAILGGHAQVYCPPEPWFLLPLVGFRNNRLFIAAAYDHYLAQEGIRELLDDQLFNNAINAFAVSVYDELLARTGKAIFIDKTPRYYQILPSLDELFPEAFKVWIWRNPLDVIASCKDSWNVSIEEMMGAVLSPRTFDITVSLPLLASFFDSIHPKKFSLKYEDLVQDPGSQIKSLCSFLGLSFEMTMINYGQNPALVETYRAAYMGDKKLLDYYTVHSGSVGRWRNVLTAQEVKLILLTLGTDIFRRLGYEEQLHEAIRHASVEPADLSEGGRLPEMLQAYSRYAETVFESPDSNTLQGANIQYSLLARQNAEREKAARKHLQRIHQLEEELESVRSENLEKGAAAPSHFTAESLGLGPEAKLTGRDPFGRYWFKIPGGEKRVYDVKKRELYRAYQGTDGKTALEKIVAPSRDSQQPATYGRS